MSEVTFVVQNETHAMNFYPITQWLTSCGISNDSVRIVLLDPVTGLDSSKCLPPNFAKPIRVTLDKPFYRSSNRERFFWLIRNRDLIANEVMNTKVLVIGNDGAIQRLMADEVRRNGGKVVLLLDGLLHPWPSKGFAYWKKVTKRKILKVAELIGLSYLVPSDVGHSDVDLIFTMNAYVKNALESQGVSTNVEVVNLPRFDTLYDEFQAIRQKTPSSGCRILYATSAFKWHADVVGDRDQQSDLRDLVSFNVVHKDVKIRVRIHPREDENDYVWLSDHPNIELTDSSTPSVADLAWASVLLTARSTLAAEAKMLGVSTVIYTKNFQPPDHHSILGFDDYFKKSSDIDTCLSKCPDSARGGRRQPSSVKNIGEKLMLMMNG